MLLPVHPEPRPGERVPSTPSNDPGCQLHQRETEGGGRCLPDRGSRSWEGLSFLGRAPAPTPPPAPGAGLKPTGLYPPPLGWGGPGTVAFSGFLIWKTRAAPHCHGEGGGWNPRDNARTLLRASLPPLPQLVPPGLAPASIAVYLEGPPPPVSSRASPTSTQTSLPPGRPP